jgi:hypothetical protein
VLKDMDTYYRIEIGVRELDVHDIDIYRPRIIRVLDITGDIIDILLTFKKTEKPLLRREVEEPCFISQHRSIVHQKSKYKPVPYVDVASRAYCILGVMVDQPAPDIIRRCKGYQLSESSSSDRA